MTLRFVYWRYRKPVLLLVLSVMVLSLISCRKAAQVAKDKAAYLVGLQAYVYGFPLVLMDVSNEVLTATPKSSEYKAPYNQFMRFRTYVNPDYKDVVRVSVNSLWSAVVFDLEQEPIIISYPDTQGHYTVIQVMNMWTDDIASFGTRTTGTSGGNFMIAGPKWNGTPPPDIKEVVRCSTRKGWVLVQMSAASPKEFPVVNAMQDKLKATPLSQWGKPYTPPSDVPLDPNVDLTATPFDQVRLMTAGNFFKRLARLLKDNPPYPADSSMLDKLKRIGVEPGKEFDIDKIDPAIAKGLNGVPAKVWDILATASYGMKNVNGWLLPVNLGRYGTDYNTRAFIAYFGLGALTSDDCIYPSALLDSEGKILDASHKYIMHFEKGDLFPSNSGVWSISAYRENFYVRNSLDRYGILPSMVKYNPDGSLDVYIQAKSPGPDKESNWLPTPPSGIFNLTLRVYQPKQTMMDGKVENNMMVGPATWTIPPVKRVE